LLGLRVLVSRVSKLTMAAMLGGGEIIGGSGPPEVHESLLAVNQEPTPGNEALWTAADQGDVAALRKALEAGGNPNFRSLSHEGQCALHRTVVNKRFECLELLLSSREGSTAPGRPTSRFNVLLDLPDLVSKNTALHFASFNGCARSIQLLQAAEADLAAQNHLGNSPLHLACSGAHTDATVELLGHGADVNAVNARNSSPLHFAIAGLPENVDSTILISKLLDQGAQVNVADSSGTTPLHIAATRGLLRVTEKLIFASADVALKDKLSHDAAWYANFKGNKEVLFALNAVTERSEPEFKHPSMASIIQEDAR